ncbi:MAG: hypothetical protein LBK74_02820, partial [Treponema sp.]|nr:hypothetical protein [Treponema sp.]
TLRLPAADRTIKTTTVMRSKRTLTPCGRRSDTSGSIPRKSAPLWPKCTAGFALCIINYRTPSFRLIAKEKQGDGRCRKVYEKAPGTPYERLMESPDISEESKAELRRRRAGQNPVELNRGLNEAVGLLLKLTGKNGMVKKPPVRRMVRLSRPDFG